MDQRARADPQLYWAMRNVSLRRRLVGGLFLVLLLLWTVVILDYRSAEERELGAVRRETAEQALMFANHANTTFRRVDFMLREMRTAWKESPVQMVEEALKHQRELEDAIVQFAVIGADGYLLYSNLGMPKAPLYLGDREHVRVHLSGAGDHLFVSRPLKDRISGKWSIQLSRPVLRGGAVVAIVVVSVDPQYFVRFYRETGMSADGAASMVRDSGEVMARSSEQDQFLDKRIATSPYADPGAPLHGSFRRASQLDGVERILSYRRLPRYGLTVLIGDSVATRLRPVHQAQRQQIFMALALSLALVFSAWQLWRSITHRHNEQLRQRHRNTVLQQLAAKDPLPDILKTIVSDIEAIRPGMVCSILLLDPDGKHLRHGAAPSLAPEYVRAIDGLAIGPNVGSCGTAAHLAQRVVVEDIAHDPRWVGFAGLAAQAGLAACWSQPILSGNGHVLGTFAVYHHKPRHPSDYELQWIEDEALLAALVIEKHRADDALFVNEERLRLAIDGAGLAIWEYDFIARRHAASPKLQGMLGLPVTATALTEQPALEQYLAADSRQALASAYENIADGATASYEAEQQWVRHDGSELWLLTRAHVIGRDASGHATRLQAVSLDITARKTAQAALREQQHLLSTILNHAPMGIWMATPQGRIRFVNQTFCRATGITEEQFLQASHYADVLPLHVGPSCMGSDQECLEGVEDVHLSYETLPFVDGQDHLLEITKVRVHGADGALAGLIGLASDVTERKAAERKLTLASKVFTEAAEGIIIADANVNIVDVNAAFTSITGYSRDEVIGQNPRLLNSGRQSPEFYAAMWRDIESKGHWSGEIWNRCKSGEVYAELLSISVVTDENGVPNHYVSLFSDITAFKEHEHQLERIAHYDVLTGLPNRILLGDRLRQAMAQAQRRGQPLALAYLDLDGFKAVNDQYGHQAGDRLLSAVAMRMKQVLREGDTLARLGGDEFVAVLSDLDNREASVPMLNRLLAAAAQQVAFGEDTLQVSASLGVAFFPQPDEVDADQLLRQADQAMYQAKLGGKNRYHIFDNEQDRNLRGHHEAIERIRQAMEDDEFVLYYQPKVHMRSGEVLGAEALIRWRHPERGILAPAHFLPAIEDHPLIVALGEWTLKQALMQTDQWQAQGLQMRVSVNIAARHLQQADFGARLRSILAEHPGVAPQSLELEVLETSALDDMAHVSQVIQECAALGVGFALDDFGTGYSSLSYLKQLPAQVLKIDQSFVRDMLDDPDDLAILEGVLGLARAFRRQAVAEGVETQAHGEMLLMLGCEWGQGYGIARPMPAGDMATWLKSWQPPNLWRNCQVVGNETLPLLYAEVEHRAWIAAVDAYLHDRRHTMPELDPRECRFGRWLEGARYRAQGRDLAALTQVHDQVHARVAELMMLRSVGAGEEARSRLPELYALRDELVKLLREWK